MQKVTGTFEITRTAEPPYDIAPGATLSRSHFAKRFKGDLDATGDVQMTSAVSEVNGSAGYVAIERVIGKLLGREGSFVLQHAGTMKRGQPSLSVTVVPDSGTGDLVGLTGSMTIDIVDGQHHYAFEFEIEPPPAS